MIESPLQIEEPDFMKDEEITLFRDASSTFFEREVMPNIDRYNKQGKVDRELWNKAGEAGMLLTSASDEYGGAGGDFRHEAVIIEQSGRMGADALGIPLHSGIIAPYIETYGSEEQKKKWIPGLASGELVAAVAMTEPGTGSDLQSVKTTALKDGNHYLINGQKTFISSGQHANLIVVVTKTDPTEGAKGISLVVVETDDVEGFSRGRNLEKLGQKAADTSELFFDNVRVPTSNLLGPEEGQGFIQLMNKLPQERLIIALQGISMIERALSVTIDYVKERNAFGKRLIDFQNTQFKLAELKTEASVAKTFTNYCIGQHLEGQLDAYTASMAKLHVTDLQCKLIDECLQLHGGYGYMLEYPIAQMYRDARVQRIYGGANDIMKVLISRTL